MSRFVRFCAFLSVLFFTSHAFAAGYSCPTYKKYTSCNSGYYLSDCGTTYSGQTISSPAAGNSCNSCPSGYTCSGGAVCPKASTVTVTFKSGSTTLGTQTLTNGVAGNLTAVSNFTAPVSSTYGWSFAGWATSVNSTTVAYTDAASATFTTNTTLYGVWKRNTYFYYYSSATSTSRTSVTRTQYYRNSSTTAAGVTSVTLPALTTQSTYAWAPAGWVRGSTTSTTKYSSSTTAVSTSPSYGASQYFYALYSRTATLAYNGNSSTGGSTTSTTGTQYYNTGNTSSAVALSLTLATNGFSKTGYTFNGWAAGSTSGTQYAAGASFTFPNKTWTSTGTYNMYATWYANCNAITLNANGGTAGSVATLYKKTGSGTWYTNSSCTTTYSTTTNVVPTRSGYTFRGFYLSDPADISATQTAGTARHMTHTGATTETGNSWTITGSATLYAGWAQNCAPGTKATCTLTVGQNTSYSTGCSTGYNIKSGSGTYNPVCQANTYTVAYNINCPSGVTCSSAPSSTSCTYDQTCTFSSISSTALYAGGYKLTGWASSSTGTAATSGSNLTTTNGGSVTRYAIWSKCAAGTYHPAATGTAANTCSACGAGKWSAAGATSCSNITAGCYGTSATTACPAVCGDNQYSAAGASSCTSCPTDYENTGTTAAAHANAASCKITVTGGYYIGTAGDNSSNWDKCAGGTYKAAHTVAYGSTSSCAACTAGNYCPSGSASQTACSSLGGGLYVNSAASSDASTDCYVKTTAGKYIKATTDTAQTTCPSGDYCPSTTLYWDNAGGNIDCPGSYTAGGTGVTAQSGCKISVADGKYVGTANSSTLSTCVAGTYKAAHTVAYGSTSSCAICTTDNTYSAAGAASCSSCPTDYKNSGTTAASHANAASCKITVSGGYYIGTAGDNSSNWDKCAGGTYKASHTVAYGSTSSCGQCPANSYCPAGASAATACSTLASGFYPNSAAGSDAASDCKTNSISGKYVAKANDSSATTCAGGTYKGSHQVNYGSTSSCGQCPANSYCPAGASAATACSTLASGFYPNSAAGSDAASDCKTNSISGKYVAKANDSSATTCAGGTYKGSHQVNYGSTSSCGQCPANSYCPAGASAATACSTLASGFYPNSAAGSDAASDCKTNSLSGKYVKTANDSSATTCSCGTYKGAHQVNYGSTSSCVTTSAGYYAAEGAASQTQASAGYYAAAGACSQTKVTAGCYTTAKGSSVACPNSCADLGGGLYKNSTSGSDAATDCYVTTTAGKYIKATTDTAQTTCPSGDYCPSTTLYWDNAGGNIDCPGSYTAGGTGLTKQAECKISVAGGKYVGSANSSTLSTCECGTYKAQHTVAYGSTSSCVTTSAGYYAAEGAASQTQASAGYYAAAGACSQTAIQAGCFGSAGSAVACPNSCPAAESGWTLASTTGLKVVTDCAEITTPSTSGSPIATICTAGTLTKKATSATAWGNPTASGLTAKAGRYVDGTTCSACAKGTYTSSATTATSCTPAAKGYYVSGTEATSQTACAAGTYTSSTGQSVCSNAAAGTYTTGCQDTTNNKACTGTAVCAQNNYSDAKASKCTACATANGYGNSGSTAASHAGVASCKVTCGAGTYVATAGAGCVNVSTGYWGAGGTVAQNATLTRMACASGLTTIGYGTGANEAADCGRKLHAGDNVIYLRSEARTSPALNVKVGDTKFYGALSTSLSGALKVKKDSTEYSVVNDWQ